jgi:hypothetical protein
LLCSLLLQQQQAWLPLEIHPGTPIPGLDITETLPESQTHRTSVNDLPIQPRPIPLIRRYYNCLLPISDVLNPFRASRELVSGCLCFFPVQKVPFFLTSGGSVATSACLLTCLLREGVLTRGYAESVELRDVPMSLLLSPLSLTIAVYHNYPAPVSHPIPSCDPLSHSPSATPCHWTHRSRL